MNVGLRCANWNCAGLNRNPCRAKSWSKTYGLLRPDYCSKNRSSSAMNLPGWIAFAMIGGIICVLWCKDIIHLL